MKRRKKTRIDHLSSASSLQCNKLFTEPLSPIKLIALVLIAICLLCLLQPANSLLLLKANCLTNWPGCVCSWRGGKFVADCATQNLSRVPKNDYFDYLQDNSGNNQMQTLNRDIQLLNLTLNRIDRLHEMEFYEKKFGNLQKLYLNANQLQHIHTSAFYKLTGLIELDLSENLLTTLSSFKNGSNVTRSPMTTTSNDTNGGDDEKDGSSKRSSKSSSSSSKESSSFKSKTTTTTTAAKKMAKTFLQDLSQLRQLNLNSNRLKRIGPFTFSPLVQLRQLYLSKNEIQSIDKRAFDGLNVLNILHLDGNKLSYLNGEILLKLPQLNALQLAGPTNRWRCDCRLRKLVRLLLHKSSANGALYNANHHNGLHQELAASSRVAASASLSILQDKPQCFNSRRPQPQPRPRQRLRFRRARLREGGGPTTNNVAAGAESGQISDSKRRDCVHQMGFETKPLEAGAEVALASLANGDNIVRDSATVAPTQKSAQIEGAAACASKQIESMRSDDSIVATGPKVDPVEAATVANKVTRQQRAVMTIANGDDDEDDKRNNNNDHDDDGDGDDDVDDDDHDAGGNVVVDDDDDDGGGDNVDQETRRPNGRLWTNMSLAEFECGPKLASDLLPVRVGPPLLLNDTNKSGDSNRTQAASVLRLHDINSNGTTGTTIIGSDNYGRRNDSITSEEEELKAMDSSKEARDKSGQWPDERRWLSLERQHFAQNEPIELTCAVELEDELDIDLTKIEWFQLGDTAGGGGGVGDGQRHRDQHRRLIWRSIDGQDESSEADTNTNSSSSGSIKLFGKRQLNELDGDDGGSGGNLVSLERNNSLLLRARPIVKRQQARNGIVLTNVMRQHNTNPQALKDHHHHHHQIASANFLAQAHRRLDRTRFAIIDYVTRANESDQLVVGSEMKLDAGAGSAATGDGGHAKRAWRRREKLIRIVHLIVMRKDRDYVTEIGGGGGGGNGNSGESSRSTGSGGNEDDEDNDEEDKDYDSAGRKQLDTSQQQQQQQQQLELDQMYLCRITNSAGQLNLMQPISVVGAASDSAKATQSAAKRRKLANLKKLTRDQQQQQQQQDHKLQLLLTRFKIKPEQAAARKRVGLEVVDEAARVALADEFSILHEGRAAGDGSSPLVFVPLHLIPSDLLLANLSSKLPRQKHQEQQPMQQLHKSRPRDKLESGQMTTSGLASSTISLGSTGQQQQPQQAVRAGTTLRQTSSSTSSALAPGTIQMQRHLDQVGGNSSRRSNDDAYDQEDDTADAQDRSGGGGSKSLPLQPPPPPSAQSESLIQLNGRANRNNDELRNFALGLIKRYTSNRRSLIALDGPVSGDDEDLGADYGDDELLKTLNGGQQQQQQEEETQQTAIVSSRPGAGALDSPSSVVSRFSSKWKSWKTHYLDKWWRRLRLQWQQPLASNTGATLLIVALLLAACLVSSIILARIHCNRLAAERLEGAKCASVGSGPGAGGHYLASKKRKKMKSGRSSRVADSSLGAVASESGAQVVEDGLESVKRQHLSEIDNDDDNGDDDDDDDNDDEDGDDDDDEVGDGDDEYDDGENGQHRVLAQGRNLHHGACGRLVALDEHCHNQQQQHYSTAPPPLPSCGSMYDGQSGLGGLACEHHHQQQHHVACGSSGSTATSSTTNDSQRMLLVSAANTHRGVSLMTTATATMTKTGNAYSVSPSSPPTQPLLGTYHYLPVQAARRHQQDQQHYGGFCSSIRVDPGSLPRSATMLTMDNCSGWPQQHQRQQCLMVASDSDSGMSPLCQINNNHSERRSCATLSRLSSSTGRANWRDTLAGQEVLQQSRCHFNKSAAQPTAATTTTTTAAATRERRTVTWLMNNNNNGDNGDNDTGGGAGYASGRRGQSTLTELSAAALNSSASFGGHQRHHNYMPISSTSLFDMQEFTCNTGTSGGDLRQVQRGRHSSELASTMGGAQHEVGMMFCNRQQLSRDQWQESGQVGNEHSLPRSQLSMAALINNNNSGGGGGNCQGIQIEQSATDELCCLTPAMGDDDLIYNNSSDNGRNFVLTPSFDSNQSPTSGRQATTGAARAPRLKARYHSGAAGINVNADTTSCLMAAARQCSSSVTSPNVTSTSSSMTLASGGAGCQSANNYNNCQAIANNRQSNSNSNNNNNNDSASSEGYASYKCEKNELDDALELLQTCLGKCDLAPKTKLNQLARPPASG